MAGSTVLPSLCEWAQSPVTHQRGRAMIEQGKSTQGQPGEYSGTERGECAAGPGDPPFAAEELGDMLGA